MSTRRMGAIFRKEMREYRRNRAIVVTMAVFPMIFAITPLVGVISLPDAASSSLLQGDPLAYLLGLPAIAPAVVAAYAVVGERQQGTLEPVLTTPIRREEFVAGKALAALVPTLVVSYVVYAIFMGCVELFAHPGVAAAALHGQQLLAQLVFTPLLAAWSIWLGLAISTRASEVRVAQQLGILASLPSIAVTTLVAYDVIHVTLGLAVVFAWVLVVLDVIGWRMVAVMFDRERLVTGTQT